MKAYVAKATLNKKLVLVVEGRAGPVCQRAMKGKISRQNMLWLAWARRLSMGKLRRRTSTVLGPL